MALLIPLPPTDKAWLVLDIYPRQTAAYLTKIVAFSFESINDENLFQLTDGILRHTIGSLKTVWRLHAIMVLGMLTS